MDPTPTSSVQHMASAAPVSPVQTAPLSAPIQSSPLAAPMSAPVRAAAVPPMSQPRVIASTAPVRATPAMVQAQAQTARKDIVASAPTRPTTSPNIAAARAVIAGQPAQTQRVAAAPIATPAAKPATTTIAKAEPAKPAQVAEAPVAKPVQMASREQPNVKSDVAPTSTAVASEDGSPEFRWPARGRIIQGFKTGKSEGISIAVPEGTAVKAAEGGTVAYAGSELKGYGNLVLIRHPNGFVSAYAHNGELMVKRGNSVKRGQVVAKSGQSGDVSSPQLQFQLRKGSTPVDPTQYLAGL